MRKVTNIPKIFAKLVVLLQKMDFLLTRILTLLSDLNSSTLDMPESSGLLRQDSKQDRGNRISGTGQLGQGIRDRMDRTGRSEHESKD
jgi:hypothetical protein